MASDDALARVRAVSAGSEARASTDDDPRSRERETESRHDRAGSRGCDAPRRPTRSTADERTRPRCRRTTLPRHAAPAVGGTGRASGPEAASNPTSRVDAPARHLDRQPEGRGRQDHDRGEPRRRAGRARLPGPGRRPRPSGQRDHRAGDQPPQRRGFDLRRHHERHAARRLRRADERARTSSSCPATIDLAGAEIELVPAFSRELKLQAGRCQSARDDYDFTLIDCPPSLGLLTVNGLAASDDVHRPDPVRVLRARGSRASSCATSRW